MSGQKWFGSDMRRLCEPAPLGSRVLVFFCRQIAVYGKRRRWRCWVVDLRTGACERLSREMSTFRQSSATFQANGPSIDLAITLIWTPIVSK